MGPDLAIGGSSSARSALIKPFYPALDGLRGLAILSVMVTHFGLQLWWGPLVRWGWVGVDVFFVLSGFLITGILFDSLSKPNFFKNFYTRRALRIFPLYYSFWLLLFLFTPLFHFHWNVFVLSTVAYFGNLFNAGVANRPSALVLVYNSVFHFPEQHRIAFLHFWSLCVEEQFYLIWPAVIFLVRSRRASLRVCLLVIVALPFLRTLLVYREHDFFLQGGLYSNTFTRLDTLLIGAALALWLRGPAPEPATLRRWSRVLAVAAPLLLLVLSLRGPSFGFYSFMQPVVTIIGFTLIGLAAAAVLVLAISRGSLTYRVLQWKPLVAIGRVSYGLYFIHGLFSEMITGKVPWLRAHHLAVAAPVLAFGVCFLLALLSFHYLESPFLKLKERFAARPGAMADPPAYGVPIHHERPYASGARAALTARGYADASADLH